MRHGASSSLADLKRHTVSALRTMHLYDRGVYGFRLMHNLLSVLLYMYCIFIFIPNIY